MGNSNKDKQIKQSLIVAIVLQVAVVGVYIYLHLFNYFLAAAAGVTIGMCIRTLSYLKKN